MRKLHPPAMAVVFPALTAVLGALALGIAASPAAAQAADAVAPDLRVDALRDFRESHGFKTMDNPKMVPAAQADFLKDTDYVLAVTVKGESRAYPTRFISWHHGINDRIQGQPYAVTYCSVCNTGIGYDLRLDGKEVFLDFHGLYNGVVALRDRETGTVFLQADGRYVKGPLTGKRLQNIPVTDTTWGQWKKLHPDTLVMSPDTPFNQFYRGGGGNATGRPNRGNLAPLFIATMTRGDLRLGAFERVMGLALSPTGEVTDKTLFRAYPLKAVLEAGGAVNDAAGDLTIAVFVEPSAETPVAFSRELDGKTLTFETRKEGTGEMGAFSVFDKETGSRWNLEGKAESGPLAGKSLKRLNSHISLWYGWSAYYPETSIYGRTDPPKPGDLFAEQRGKG